MGDPFGSNLRKTGLFLADGGFRQAPAGMVRSDGNVIKNKNILNIGAYMKKIVPVLVISALFLAGCSTLDKAYIEDESNRVEFDGLNLQMGYDLYQFNVDLVRNTTTETTTSTDSMGFTTTETTTKDVPYHYLVVRFGNGMIYDYNGNFRLDLIEFYDLDEDDFSITKKNKGFFGAEVEYEKTDNSFRREVHSLLGSVTTAEIREDKIHIEEGMLGIDVDLLLSENEIQCIPEGVFGFLAKARVSEVFEETRVVEFPGFWDDWDFTQENDHSINLEDDFAVRSSGNEITVEYRGLFGYKIIYHMIRTADGFIFYDEYYRGVKVEKKGDKITVYTNSKVTFKAEIR